MTPYPELANICDEMGVRLVPVTKQREPMETCAVNTLERILREHGPEHLRSVLIVIVETGNNKRQLVAPVIWAVSDLLLAHPSWFGSALLDAMDGIDLAEVHESAKANRRAAQPRAGVSTILFERLRGQFAPDEQGRLI
ncbi:hypothetical protein [Bradyrhizobium sp. Ai1a-2]|uniref:hypothetical protein n=1 Tax=Bradyrhizobium sp. Ai1a-2 TaxID=196490 RepID=UPI0004253C39|nr:hypothetical protein [Bradyrhizobium sp. Ai1a-2]